ncbi:DNA cytosine methyltransferase [Xanthomonas arboricola]|uniref:DNA cytosine methyltransferase n=1 Tax=Xanthomonas arboricola TaxID=56448 RepID=UPI003EB87E55
MYKVASLFSGCGGLDLGFKQAGFEMFFATDNDPSAVEVYRRNVDKRAYLFDVTEAGFHDAIAKLKNIDVVLGGFPCQGFSKAGPKKIDDSRNSLYLQMLATVEKLKPKVFIAENVDGLRQNFGGRYLKDIIENFSDIGYKVEYRVFDAVAFGLPQHRRRIFFVGIKDGGDFEWPTPTHLLPRRNGDAPLDPEGLFYSPAEHHDKNPTRTVRDAIQDLPALGSFPDHQIVRSWPAKHEEIMKMIGPGQKLCNVRFAESSVYTWNIPKAFGAVSEKQRKILELIGKNRRKKIYGTIPNGNPIPADEIARLGGLKKVPEVELSDLVNKGYLKKTGNKYDLKGAMFCSGLFKRLQWDSASPTVLTNFHNPRYFLHPSETRPLSLRECARLQGFPDTFIITQNDSNEDLLSGYRLIGNAVPPPLAHAFAISTLKTLNR